MKAVAKLVATGALGGLLVLPGVARASAYCTGVPVEINTHSDGTVMLFATWRNDWISVCNIDRIRDGVTPTMCMTWAAQLVTAASQGKMVGFYYENASNCTSIANFANSPAPTYIRFIGN
jgi:hypothetical protein